jgi:hypothetical protein
MNYLKYYNLEDYLFSEVTKSFRDRGYLTSEEFFSIVIWKANRSKGRIKAKLTKGRRDLDTAVKDLTTQIHQAASDEERLRILLSKDWAFGLATASAVLTVLYPDRFTVYDVHVRGQLNIKDFAGRTDQIVLYFKQYLPKVAAIPEAKTFRDKDRYLWGKSAYEDLQAFLRKL